MKAFLLSNAGKGTMGVCLTALILVCPLVASWMVAGLTLFFAVYHLREAFRRLEAGAPLPPRVSLTREVAVRGRARPCDVNSVMPPRRPMPPAR
jgi:hypothetical protein